VPTTVATTGAVYSRRMAAGPDRVVGDYILRTKIGGGGMSEVFAAEHRGRGDAVAVKVLRPHLAADEAQAARFLAEATRTRAVAHPNVVRVLDCGRDDDGTLYLVMERIDGEDLAARLARAGRLDEGELRRLGAAIADGMQAAHERGVIHRDLKPANILIGAGGAPKIVDFGIAKMLTGDSAATGPAMGTPHYMAPEQLSDGAVAPSVDIWALGVTLFEAATGTLPFTDFANGRCPQLVEPPPRPGERAPLSVGLETLILQCLKRSAAARPATMREIAERLRSDETALERATAPIAPATAPIAPAASGSRRRWLTRAAAALIVLSVAGLAIWRSERHPTPARAPQPVVAEPTPPVVSAPAVVPSPPGVPSPPPIVAPARPQHRSHHHAAAHRVRSRVYGEKLD
jgi:eukaryotic-like serine/threonine-protein kinase